MSKMKAWFVPAGLLAVFVALSATIRKDGPTTLDDALSGWIAGFRSEGLTAFFKALSPLVSTPVFAVLLIIFSLLFAFGYRKRMEPILLVVNLAIAFAMYKGLKGLFERPRPSGDRLIEAAGYSFPSGNALMAASFYGFVIVILYRLARSRSKAMARMIAVFGFALIGLIGISRIYLGVHYPSDILAGFALGGAWVAVCAALSTEK